jgi:hypothetical protein
MAQQWEVVSDTTGPLERAIATLSPAEVARLKQRLEEAITPFATANGIAMPGLALCASGTR